MHIINQIYKASILSKLSLLVIACTMLLALFAEAIVPDKTVDANSMILELGAKAPGFTKTVFKIPVQKNIVKRTALSKFWYGEDAQWTYIPYNNLCFAENELLLVHYIDDTLEDTLKINYSTILPTSKWALRSTDKQAYILNQHTVTIHYLLGSDKYGRDILSRLVLGSRVSLAVGIISVVLTLLLGITFGMLAGYFGGTIDKIIQFIISIIWSIPTLLLVFAITLSIGKGFWQLFIAIGCSMWVSTARLIRGHVMSLKQNDYITAAKALGLSNWRIMYHHLLPNCSSIILVMAASNFASAILVEAGLSFLGIGIQAPQSSWGLMIKEQYNLIITDKAILALLPGFAIMLLVYAFHILGNTLRDLMDVKQN